MVELINADDFFNVLEEHEVISAPKTQEKKDEMEEIKENIQDLL